MSATREDVQVIKWSRAEPYHAGDQVTLRVRRSLLSIWWGRIRLRTFNVPLCEEQLFECTGCSGRETISVDGLDRDCSSSHPLS